MRILVIEDDKDVASFIRNGLVQAGCNVDHAANGKDGLFLATTENYDALVVDRMLPGVDGLTVIRTLRASSNSTPVLILIPLTRSSTSPSALKIKTGVEFDDARKVRMTVSPSTPGNMRSTTSAS